MRWIRNWVARWQYRRGRERAYWEQGYEDLDLGRDSPSPPPSARARAARTLAESELWPEPTGLLGWRRWMFGRPRTTGSDELAMRADADRAARSIDDSPESGPRPHPALANLASRSRRRVTERCERPCARLAKTLARTTAAQAHLDHAGYERDEAAGEIATMPESLPRPRLGVALTSAASVWTVMIAVLIPLESFLTYRQLLVLGMSDTATRTFAILIGLALVVVAEVVGFLCHYLMTQPDGEPDETARRALGARYWFVAVLTVAIVGTGVVTLHGLAVARQHNQQILVERERRQSSVSSELKASGYLKSGQSGSHGIATQETEESARVDLSWSFWLQLLAFLAAVAIAVRRRDAHDYNERERERRRRVLRARRAERQVQRQTRRVAAATGRYEAVLRQIRLVHEGERELLVELFDRVRAHVRHMDEALVPGLEDLEIAISRTTAPELESIGQPTVSSMPTPDPPPRPRPRTGPEPEPETVQPDQPPAGPPPGAPPSPDSQPGSGVTRDHPDDPANRRAPTSRNGFAAPFTSVQVGSVRSGPAAADDASDAADDASDADSPSTDAKDVAPAWHDAPTSEYEAYFAGPSPEVAGELTGSPPRAEPEVESAISGERSAAAAAPGELAGYASPGPPVGEDDPIARLAEHYTAASPSAAGANGSQAPPSTERRGRRSLGIVGSADPDNPFRDAIARAYRAAGRS